MRTVYRFARVSLLKKFHGSNRHFTSEVLICGLKIHYPGMAGIGVWSGGQKLVNIAR